MKRVTPIMVSWQPPMSGFMKLNVDGSSLENPGSLGAEFFVRDEHGTLRYAATLFMGEGNSFKAELFSLLHGIRYCFQHDLQQI